MWASSRLMTSAARWSSGWLASAGSMINNTRGTSRSRGFPSHRTRSRGWRSGQPCRRGRGLRSSRQTSRGLPRRHRGRTRCGRPDRGGDDTDGHTARMDRFGAQRADDKGDEVGRHHHRRGVLNAATSVVERGLGDFARVGDARCSASTISVVSKVALYSGSSQHGKQRRASVDWNWVGRSCARCRRRRCVDR